MPEAAGSAAPIADSQRVVFLEALGLAVRRGWPDLHAELLPAESGRQERLAVVRLGTREEIGCDFDARTGWHYVWLWPHPRRIAPTTAVAAAARTVASALGCRTLTV